MIACIYSGLPYLQLCLFCPVVAEGVSRDLYSLIEEGYSRYTIYVHTHVGNVLAYVYSKVVEKLVGVSLSEVEYVLSECTLCAVKTT